MMKKTIGNFTLIELLVVIAIIAILAGILMPALNSALQRGKIILCTSNQKFIAMGLNMYASDNKEFYPSANYSDQPWNYWWRAILMGGYLGKTFKSKDQVYDISKRGKTVLICPEDSDPASGGTGVAATDYRSYGLNGGIADSGTGYGLHYIPRFYLRPGSSCGKAGCTIGWGIVQKGPQQTFLTADSRAGRVIWWGNQDKANEDRENPRAMIYPFHRVGVPISFVDGHVRFVKYPFTTECLNFENSKLLP